MKKTIYIFVLLWIAIYANALKYIGEINFDNQQNTKFISLVSSSDPNDEPYTIQTQVDGKLCIYIPYSKYAYFDVDEAVILPDNHDIVIKMTYFDNGIGQLKFQYNSTTNNYSDAIVDKAGSQCWTTATIALRNVSLRNAQNQNADFRINDNNYISRIELYEGVLEPTIEPIVDKQPSDYSDMNNKSVAGYQAWFGVGGKNDNWQHWSSGNMSQDGSRWPQKDNCSFDYYPDITIYADSVLEQTGFSDMGNGQPALLFPSNTENVVSAHFDLMEKYDIDGVAVQRFISPSLKTITHSDKSTLNLIKQSAERTKRIFYVCYDISSTGLESQWAEIIKFDWVYNIEQNNQLVQSASYATMKDKPIVEIWGTGFIGNHPGTVQETIELVEFFKQRGCYVIGGVPTYWRENKNDAKGPTQANPADRESFEDVYKHYDMISPWMVGRFDSPEQYASFHKLIEDDLLYCKQYGMQYLPVVFAGFSWSLWNNGVPNQIPRRGGEFLWQQVKFLSSLNIKQVYFAMFDEYDEGTALLNAATDHTEIPSNAWFLTNSADGIWCSSDFYLRLTSDISSRLKYDKPFFDSVQVPYSPDKVKYRNSFEMRETKYNYVNNIAQSVGVFPVDPCFYNNKIMLKSNIQQVKAEITDEEANSGMYSAKITIDGVGQTALEYQIAELKIPVSCDLLIRSYFKGTGMIYVAFRSGEKLYSYNFEGSADFRKVVLYIPASFIGDTLSSIGFVFNKNILTQEIVYIDDILIEQADTQTILPTIYEERQDGGLYDLLGYPISRPRKGMIYIDKAKGETRIVVSD